MLGRCGVRGGVAGCLRGVVSRSLHSCNFQKSSHVAVGRFVAVHRQCSLHTTCKVLFERNNQSQRVEPEAQHTTNVDESEQVAIERPQFHAAAFLGDLETMKQVLTEEGQGVLVSVDTDNNTALHVAAMQGHMHVVQWLLERSVDPNLKGIGGYTALHLAVGLEDAKLELIDLLLGAGADPFLMTDHQLSACVLAIENNRLDIANRFIGCKSSCTYDMRLHAAAKLGHVDLINAIVASNVSPDAVDPFGCTALHVACVYDKTTSFVALLDAKANTFCKTNNSHTIAHMCALFGSRSCLGVIGREFPSLLDQPDERGFLPLHLAAQANQPDVVELLLSHGADPNAQAHDTLSPLHMAAMNGHDDFISALITHATSLNMSAPAIDGLTPLHLAAMAGKLSTLKLLLESGADLHAKTESGQTAADFAQLALFQADGRIDKEVAAEMHKNNVTDDGSLLSRELSQDDVEAVQKDLAGSVNDLEDCCDYLEGLVLKDFVRDNRQIVDDSPFARKLMADPVAPKRTNPTRNSKEN